MQTIKHMIKIFLVLLLFLFSFPVISSEISFDRENAQIVFTGTITKGDFEKFLNATLEGGTRVGNVYLASNGGDVAEAMRIGRLIRTLGYSTRVPFTGRYGSHGEIIKPICQKNIAVTDQECTCMSSCALIYLAGVERTGDYIGVHRAYLNHDQLKELSLENAKKAATTISAKVNKYMLEMQAPISLIDKTNSMSSNEIELLPIDYVDKYLDGFTPDYKEWLIAKCGDREEYFRKLFKNPKAMRITDERFECYHEQRVTEIERRFYMVVKKALKATDPKLIPHRSLLEYISRIDQFDITDLVGKMNNEAIDLMSLMSVGLPSNDSALKAININIMYKRAISVVYSPDGTVYAVELFFNGWNSDTRGYEGHFIDGLSSSSKPNDFIQKYGSPSQSSADGRFLYFDLNKTKLRIVFDGEQRLISIQVAPLRKKGAMQASKNT